MKPIKMENLLIEPSPNPNINENKTDTLQFIPDWFINYHKIELRDAVLMQKEVDDSTHFRPNIIFLENEFRRNMIKTLTDANQKRYKHNLNPTFIL